MGNLKYSKTEHWQHCHESSKDYIVSSHGTNAPDCTIPCVELNIQTTYASFFILFISFYPFFQYVYNGTCNVDKKESLRFRDRSSIFRTYANESIMFILACKVELSRITNNRNHKTSYYDGLNGECVYYERLSVYWKCMLIREHISPWKNKLHEYLNSSVVELFFFFFSFFYSMSILQKNILFFNAFLLILDFKLNVENEFTRTSNDSRIFAFVNTNHFFLP